MSSAYRSVASCNERALAPAHARARAGSIDPVLTVSFACLQQGFDPRGFGGGGVGGSKRSAAPIPFDEAPIQVNFN